MLVSAVWANDLGDCSRCCSLYKDDCTSNQSLPIWKCSKWYVNAKRDIQHELSSAGVVCDPSLPQVTGAMKNSYVWAENVSKLSATGRVCSEKSWCLNSRFFPVKSPRLHGYFLSMASVSELFVSFMKWHLNGPNSAASLDWLQSVWNVF